MINKYFKVLRSGTHTTFQDKGFFNLQHLGITTSGVVDNELAFIANALVNNDIYAPIIEFAYQGPRLKLIKGSCRFAISGNVNFNIIKNNKTIIGKTNQTYKLEEGEILDILSTIKSNYGYFAIEGSFKIKKEFNSNSTLTNSKIGSNNGNCLKENQKICFTKSGSNYNSYININQRKIDKFIRVVSGPQMNFFMLKVIKKFFNNSFIVSNITNRVGVRLEGNIIKSIKSHNIASEGITKGAIQIPANGNPIILLNDHPTIGGYPKIANVILADVYKIAQYPIGTKFSFKKVNLDEAENILFEKEKNQRKILNQIKIL